MHKIVQDAGACIGCGACVSICPDNWKMGSDGKAHPKKTAVAEIGCNKDAADSCPVQCIHVK